MATLGQEINALLKANGVPGTVREVAGGPSTLVVTYWEVDEQGRKVIANGVPQLGVVTLDLHKPSAPPQPRQPRQHGSIDQLVRDAEAGDV